MSHVILLAGPAGCGKSTTAALLEGTIVLGKDALTRPMCEALLAAHGADPNFREGDIYLTQVRPLEYAILMAALDACMRARVTVVVDAPFLCELEDPAWVDALRQSVSARGARLHIIWLTAASTVLRARLVERGAGRDRGKLSGALAVPSPPLAADWVIDTTDLPAPDVAGRIRALCS